MAKNELLPFANGEDANVLPTNQWEALTDILENGFQSGIARSEQVNRVLAQGAVASYVLGQLIVDELNQDATLDKDTLYQRLVSALKENAKDACLPLTGGEMTGQITFNKSECLLNTKESNQDMRIGGGAGYSSGTVLYMFGKDSTRGQGFYLRTVNKDNQTYQLTSDGYGSLTWNGYNIITSAGGTFTGTNVSKVTTALAKNDNTSILAICGGTGYGDGATFEAYGAERTVNGGSFAATAKNSSRDAQLLGRPNGDLTWDGHSINQYLKVSTSTGLAVDGTEVTVPYDGLVIVSVHRSSSDEGNATVVIDGGLNYVVKSNNFSYGYLTLPVQKGQTFKVTKTSLSSCGAKLVAFK